MVLLFDGSCSLCRRASERLVRLAAPNTIQRLSFRDPGVLDRFPQISAAACEQAMQLVLDDGRVISGAHAAFAALATRWYLRPALWLYLIPGIRQLTDALYRLIARNRHRLGNGSNNVHSCDTGSCRMK